MSKKEDLTLGERAINWSKAAALIIGAFGTAYGASMLRGEPGAELSYKKLNEQLFEVKVDLAVMSKLVGKETNPVNEEKLAKIIIDALKTKKVQKLQALQKQKAPSTPKLTSKFNKIKKPLEKVFSTATKPMNLEKSKQDNYVLVSKKPLPKPTPPKVQQAQKTKFLEHIRENVKKKFLPPTLDQLKQQEQTGKK